MENWTEQIETSGSFSSTRGSKGKLDEKQKPRHQK
jgi:hypothetical protein